MKRKIICADALEWLGKHRSVGAIVTSLPDIQEVSMTEGQYIDWFCQAVTDCFKSTSDNCPTIFYQTDRKLDGKRISKAFLIMLAAQALDRHLIWHKIVLRRDVGKIDLRRPGYSHLLCFGNLTSGKATPDVIESGGVLYSNGMGLNAAHLALDFASRHTDRICDPFCGRGTVPLIAERQGFKRVVGVDIDPEQCKAAKQLRQGFVRPSKSGKRHTRLFKD